MSATYMHIGIPITNKKPGMVYNEGAKFWVSNVDDYDYKIEYLKFEEGTPFPEEIHRNPHVAYKVDDLEHYIADADSVICGPMAANDKGDRLAFGGRGGPIWDPHQEPKFPRHRPPPPEQFCSGGAAFCFLQRDRSGPFPGHDACINLPIPGKIRDILGWRTNQWTSDTCQRARPPPLPALCGPRSAVRGPLRNTCGMYVNLPHGPAGER